MRALVVDDHDLTRKYVRELLMEECGFPEVEEAEDGVDALARLTKNRYDLAVIDINMPRKDGISLMTEARGLGIDAEFIVLSEMPRDVYAPRAAELGAVFLEKSDGPEGLIAAAREAAARARPSRRGRSPSSG
jgi:DNA-binding NarL/FixJ family response regulator